MLMLILLLLLLHITDWPHLNEILSMYEPGVQPRSIGSHYGDILVWQLEGLRSHSWLLRHAAF